jgi:two-component system, OmpR family, response regulator TctD
MKLLVVEDDLDLGDAVARMLQTRGFEVTRCAHGAEAIAMVRRGSFDAVLLDLNLPDKEGMDVLRTLRDGGHQLPVLVMTARTAVHDRVLGLNLGADDYLTKPFDIEELAARLKALVRRAYGTSDMTCALLRIDANSGAVYRGHSPLEVSSRELALLKVLLARPGQAVAKDDLHRAIFGDDAVGPDAVEVLVHRLRKRIQGSGAQLVTLRGVGYLIIDEALG